MTPERRAITAEAAPAAVGPYSHAVVAGGLLFCSAQIPLDPASGELVPGGVGDRTRRCLDNLAAVCAGADASIADAVRVTLYLTDLAHDWAEVNDAYGRFFAELGGDPPARAAIGVAALPQRAPVAVEAVVALAS